MLRTTAISAIAAVAGLAFASAQAGEHRDARALQPASPQPIAEVVKAGGGTVSGTVGQVAATWLVLEDGTDRIDVTTRGFLPQGIEPGSQLTVVGPVRDGAIRASQIIREDGAAFGRPAREDRERRQQNDRGWGGHDGDRRGGHHGGHRD